MGFLKEHGMKAKSMTYLSLSMGPRGGFVKWAWKSCKSHESINKQQTQKGIFE